jgi:hypothetical protein
MLKRLSLVGTLLVVSLAIPQAAQAVTQIPPDSGFNGRLVDGKIVSMRFSPSLFRQVAGRRVVIACTQMGETGPGIHGEGVGSEAFRMPKRRRVVRRFVGPGYDYCTLRLGRRHIGTFAVSERGAVAVDEQYQAIALVTVLDSAALRRALPVVPLASPSDTPPAGSIGYYSDGGQHVAAVVLSDAGRRLFIELDADDVIRTNVARYLYGGII